MPADWMGGWVGLSSSESLWEQLQPAAAAAAAITWPEQQAGFLTLIFETHDQSDEETWYDQTKDKDNNCEMWEQQQHGQQSQ